MQYRFVSPTPRDDEDPTIPTNLIGHPWLNSQVLDKHSNCIIEGIDDSGKKSEWNVKVDITELVDNTFNIRSIVKRVDGAHIICDYESYHIVVDISFDELHAERLFYDSAPIAVINRTMGLISSLVMDVNGSINNFYTLNTSYFEYVVRRCMECTDQETAAKIFNKRDFLKEQPTHMVSMRPEDYTDRLDTIDRVLIEAALRSGNGHLTKSLTDEEYRKIFEWFNKNGKYEEQVMLTEANRDRFPAIGSFGWNDKWEL